MDVVDTALRSVVLLALLHSCQSQSSAMLYYTVAEDLQADHILGNIITDARIQYSPPVLRSLQFKILPGRYTRYFSVEESGGTLSTSGNLDRDDICVREPACNLLLDVAIVEPVPYKDVFKVNVTLLDANDNSPQFADPVVRLSVSESAPVGFSFMLPTATDRDSGVNEVQRYVLSSPPGIPFRLVSIANPDGSLDISLELTERLDRENRVTYTAVVTAYDGGDPPRSGIVTLTVIVLDNNDNSPAFIGAPYTVVVDEGGPQGVIARVQAVDVDSGSNGRIEYGFESRTARNYGHRFTINATTGDLSVRGALDFESQPFYQLFVTATDGGARPLSTTAVVGVHVRDVNDHRPVITVNALTASGRVELSEDARRGTYVALVLVEDADGGRNGELECRLTARYFSLERISSAEYKIVSTATFDREREPRHRIILACQDGGEPALVTSRDINVIILDENDHSPRFTNHTYEAVIAENTTGIVIRVEATDADTGENSRVLYTIMGDDGHHLNIDTITGDVGVVNPFDYELIQSYEFLVVATDQGTHAKRATTSVSFRITDINDEAPTFHEATYSFATYENQAGDTTVGRVHAVDADSPPYDSFTYSLREHPDAIAAFLIDSTTGVIRTRQPLDREQVAVYGFVVVAADTSSLRGLSSTANVVVDVADRNDNPPVIAYPRPTNQSLMVSAATPVGYTFVRVVASDADSGARLIYTATRDDSGGLFTVDPASGGVSVGRDLRLAAGHHFRLAVRVRDEGDHQAEASFTLVVNASLPFNGSLMTATNTKGAVLSYHQMIVIVLAAVTTVIISLLLTAIAFIRRRQRAHDKSVQAARHLVAASGTKTMVAVYEGPAHELVVRDGGKTRKQVESSSGWHKEQDADSASGSSDLSNADSGRGSDEGDRRQSANSGSGRGSDEGDRRQSENSGIAMTSPPTRPPRAVTSRGLSHAAHRAAVTYRPQSEMAAKQHDAVKKCVQFKDLVDPYRTVASESHDFDDASSVEGSYVVDIDSALHGVTV